MGTAVCVIGGTGMLGCEIVRQALAAGHQLTVVTRDPARVFGRVPASVDVRRGDLTDPRSLPAACRGADVVVASAHAMLGRGSSRSELVDDQGHRALIDSAKSAGARHFIYVSVLGASPSHPVDFWRTKAGIEACLAASGLPFTIVRPAAFMEMHAHELIGKSILARGTATVLGRGDRPMNFVAVRDVAALVVRAIDDASLRNQAIDVGGPENLTQNEVAALYGRIAGRAPTVHHVPRGLLRVLASVIGVVHPGIARIMRASLASATLDQTFDPRPLLAAHPMTLTRLEDVARENASGRVTSGRSAQSAAPPS